ncbi:MAG: phenylalanine--tRNA ligase subunit alpha, partial [Isosphaeraceae bacterium]
MSSNDPLEIALRELESLEQLGIAALVAASSPEALETARIEYLGQKQGKLKAAQERLRTLDPAGKRVYGQRFNGVKQSLEAALSAARLRLGLRRHYALPADTGDYGSVGSPARLLERRAIDVTLPGAIPRLGHRHPLTQTADELIDLFGRFGFSVARGPEVEDIHHNFDALNIPPSHPARDPLDNFFLSEGTMLRSQTSTVQIRVMEAQRPPVRVIAIGRVYRPDTVDATHSFMFHQIEGLMVDRGVTMADLKTVLRLFARSYLGHDVKIRFRPSFFPFTEPSVEVDMLWHGGDRWVEMGGAGMVDPNVFRAVGYDPEEVTGFAFGLGIER